MDVEFLQGTNSLKTINMYRCMGCEMSAFNNAPKCAQKKGTKNVRIVRIFSAHTNPAFHLAFLSFFWFVLFFNLMNEIKIPQPKL